MDAIDQARPAGSAAPTSWRWVTGLVRACHPAPSVAVTVLVSVLAVTAGQDGPGCLLLAAAVLTGQLSVGWSNDAADAGRDSAARRSGKPVVDGAIGAGTVRAASIAALAVCVPLSLAYGLLAGSVHLIGVAAAWAYNLGMKSTVLSWLPYAVGFAALPAFVTLGLPGRPWPAWWAVIAAAMLGVGAHLANVLPDTVADLATGVRGWPQRLGPARVRLLLPVPLVAASAVLATAPVGSVDAVGQVALSLTAGMSVAGALLGRNRGGMPFRVAITVAAVDVAMLLWQGSSIT